MSVPFSQILQEAPTNPAHVTGYTSGTGRDWATRYPPITGTRLSVHTRNVLGTDGKEATVAGWEAMVPRFGDDQLRLNTLAQRPNRRPYRLGTGSDMALWFHTEVSNVVLAAWNGTPAVLQTSEAKAWTEQPCMEIADVTYSPVGGDRPPLVIGEFKRNLLRRDQWQEGRNPSKPLSRELGSGKTPPDNQFASPDTRTSTSAPKSSASTARPCCCCSSAPIYPTRSSGRIAGSTAGLSRGRTRRAVVRCARVSITCSSRGFRRCQGYAAAPNLSVDRYTPQYREFFSGRPVFAHDNGALRYEHPQNGPIWR
ncbi:hypothetical protein RB593_006313 [Gaeumannomyces tritici]